MASYTAKDIMTTGVVSVTQDLPIFDVAKILSDHNFAGVPVVDEKSTLLGIITEYDLISASSALHLPTLQAILRQFPIGDYALAPEIEKISGLTAKDVMNKDPFVLKENATTEEIIAAFREHHRVNPIPVVNESKKVLGIISRYDLVKIFDEAKIRAYPAQALEDTFKLLQKDYAFVSKIAAGKIDDDLQYAKTFEEAIMASAASVIISGVDANIIYVNPSWERLNGYTLEEVRGKNSNILKSGKTPKEVYKKLWEELSAGKSFTTDTMVNKRKNGTEYCEEIAISPVQKNGKTVFYAGVIRDVTQRKETERVRGEFIALTSHQLATPLTAISWNADLLLGGYGGSLTQEQREYISQMHIQSKSLLELVELFLNITRIEAGNLSVKNLPMKISEISDNIFNESVSVAGKKNLKLTKMFDESVVNLDERFFRIIFGNLISNAVKYTTEGGAVIAEVKKTGDKILIKVSDTGQGIPEDEQSKVFSKLFRAKNASLSTAEGTGLGLYLVKLVIDKIGGTIKFESEEGKGSIFYVELPVVA